jgi:hypothetical protein
MLSVTPVQVRLPDEERNALDQYRRAQQNPPSRARAARELICLALASTSSSLNSFRQNSPTNACDGAARHE